MADPYSDAHVAELLVGPYAAAQGGFAAAASRAAYAKAYRRLYAEAYQELCETVTGEAPSAEPPDEEWFADQVLHFLEQNGERAHQARPLPVLRADERL